MITLDQVKLLEQKVESAVEKIQQLQAENDALRNKCSELSNALSTKSEQLTFFEQDQNQIESGILKALERLGSIENTILKTAASPAPAATGEQRTQQQTNQNSYQAPASVLSQNSQPAPAESFSNPVNPAPQAASVHSEPARTEDYSYAEQDTAPDSDDFSLNGDILEDESEYDSQEVQNPGFDIF